MRTIIMAGFTISIHVLLLPSYTIRANLVASRRNQGVKENQTTLEVSGDISQRKGKWRRAKMVLGRAYAAGQVFASCESILVMV